MKRLDKETKEALDLVCYLIVKGKASTTELCELIDAVAIKKKILPVEVMYLMLGKRGAKEWIKAIEARTEK